MVHRYWFLIGPPFLVPVYFHYDVIKYMISNRKYLDLLVVLAAAARSGCTICDARGDRCQCRWCWLTQAGALHTLVLYLFVRFLESHWFTWVTQVRCSVC